MELVLLSRLATNYWNGFRNQQPGGLSTRELANVSPIETTNLTKVDQKTFATLCLAQEAIHHTHQVLSKGTSNQVEHLVGNNRAGLQNDGTNLYLDRLIMPVVEKIQFFVKAPGGTFSETDKKWDHALRASVAHYYQGGNCGFHVDVAISYLLAHSPPGTKITHYVGTEIDHALVVIETLNDSGHPVKIICDAYPAHNSQAVLIEDYFILPNKMKPFTGVARDIAKESYGVYNFLMEAVTTKLVGVFSYEVTEENHGVDYMKAIYSELDTTEIKRVLQECTQTTKLQCFSLAEVNEAIDAASPPLFRDLHTTGNKKFHDYETEGRKFSDFQAGLQQTTKIPVCPLINGNGKTGIELNPAYVKQAKSKQAKAGQAALVRG